MILEELLVPLKLDTSKFESAIDDAISKGNGLQAGLAKVGGGIVLGAAGLAAGAITAISTATVVGIQQTSEWAGKLDSVSDLLGTTADESAGLALMSDRLGMDTGNLTGMLAKMTNGLVGADGQLGNTGKSLEALGVSVFDANGNMRSSTDIFQDVADVLGNMPDGLEKSGLEMELFGKSGAEMGDVLAAAANGGLAKFNQEAKDLGLSLSDEQVANMIEFQKQGAKLKETFQGITMKLGMAVIPALSKLGDIISAVLARPDVQAGIQALADGIGNLATTAVNFLPQAINALIGFANWLIQNQGVVVGILAALGVAVLTFAYTSLMAAIPAITAFITAFAPVLAIMAAVGVAAYLLYQAWTTNFGGIQDKAKAAWAFIQPILQNLWNWLSVNVPIAIQALANYWTNVLQPALVKVWGWMNSTLFPFLSALANFLGAVFHVAITALAGAWQNVLWPALQKVYSFLQANVFPIFQSVGSFISSKFAPAFDGLSSAIQGVTSWLSNMADMLNNMQLPSWLTPGSPTPFENGLRGIGDAMKDLNGSTLPDFSANLNMKEIPAGNTNTGNQMDYQQMTRAFRDALLTVGIGG